MAMRLARQWRVGSSQKRQDLITAYLCLLPWMAGFLSFVFGPMLFSLGLSFFRSDLLTSTFFVGLDNYRDLFREDLFWKSLRVTFIYAFSTVPLGSCLALMIALVLNQKLLGLGIWRTIYYLPTVISGVAVSLLWLQIFNPRAGLLNNFLAIFSVDGPSWLYSSTWALPSLIIMSVWGVGANMLLYLAGLQGIPTHLYEAATIDGANSIRKFWHVTIPMLTPTIFFNVTIGLIYAFQFFTQAFIMTRRGAEQRHAEHGALPLPQGVPADPFRLRFGRGLGPFCNHHYLYPDIPVLVPALGLLRRRSGQITATGMAARAAREVCPLGPGR